MWRAVVLLGPLKRGSWVTSAAVVLDALSSTAYIPVSLSPTRVARRRTHRIRARTGCAAFRSSRTFPRLSFEGARFVSRHSLHTDWKPEPLAPFADLIFPVCQEEDRPGAL